MLGHGEDLHLLVDGSLDDFFQGICGMTTELAGVGVVGEWHGGSIDASQDGDSI